MAERRCSNWIDSFLQYNRRSQTPPLFFKWAALSCLSAALQRKAWLQWDQRVFPNNYVLIVAPSGVGKGAPLGVSSDLLRRIKIPLSAQRITPEGFLARFAAATKPVPNKDLNGYRYDAEGMTAFSVVSPEFTVFLRRQHVVDGFLDELIDLYDCIHPWEYAPKLAAPAYVQGSCLNIFAATTPENLGRTLPYDATGSGFTARCIFVFSDDDRRIVLRPQKRAPELDLLEALVSDLKHISENVVGPFETREDWLKLWDSWYPTTKTHPPLLGPKFDSYLHRRGTHLQKMCMAISAARDDSRVLDAEVFMRALELLDEVEKDMPRVFFGHGKNPLAELLPSILRYVHRVNETTVSAVVVQFVNEATKTDIETILDTLIQKGDLVKFQRADKWWVKYTGPIQKREDLAAEPKYVGPNETSVVADGPSTSEGDCGLPSESAHTPVAMS